MTAAKSEKSAAGLKAAIIPVTPFQQNCTLLWDEASKKGAVVDPGGDLDRIKAAIRKSESRSSRSCSPMATSIMRVARPS